MNEDLRGNNNWSPGGCFLQTEGKKIWYEAGELLPDAPEGYDALDPMNQVVVQKYLPLPPREVIPVPVFQTVYTAEVADDDKDSYEYYSIAATSIVEAAQKVTTLLVGRSTRIQKIERSEHIDEVLV